jgi:hypothetical protein
MEKLQVVPCLFFLFFLQNVTLPLKIPPHPERPMRTVGLTVLMTSTNFIPSILVLSSAKVLCKKTMYIIFIFAQQ